MYQEPGVCQRRVRDPDLSAGAHQAGGRLLHVPLVHRYGGELPDILPGILK